MSKPAPIERDPLYVVAPPIVTEKTKRFGHIIVWGTFTLMFLLAIIQFLNTNEYITFGFLKYWRRSSSDCPDWLRHHREFMKFSPAWS